MLCRTYWQPVRRYLTALGCREADAADVTQEFFAAFLRGRGFAAATPEAGRLRTLVKKAAQNHLFSHWRRNMAEKRGGAATPVPLDAEAEDRTAEHSAAAEAAYDREWALTVLDSALRQLEESYLQRGRETLFRCIKDGLLRPGGLTDHAAAARELGIPEAQVRLAVHRARQRLGKLLRSAVAETAVPAEVEDEVRHLLAVLIETRA